MDAPFREQDEMASLGIVFFANAFVRALDQFRTSRARPETLALLCDKAISSLHSFQRADAGTPAPATGLMSTADEVATLATSLERHFGIKTSAEASDAVDNVLKGIGRIKTQKEFTDDLKQRVDEVVAFFEHLSEEGLTNSRRQATGEATEAERVWQHYAMSY